MTKSHPTAVILACLVAFVASLAASLLLGAANLSELDPEQARTILFSIRMPRTLVAALCGGALAAAGAASQGLFRNGLASPSILGTEAGGACGAALLFYAGAATWHWLTLPLAAFAGCLVATTGIFAVASRLRTPTLEFLLLVGFAFNALASALTSLVVSLTLEDYQKAQGVMHWLLGGFDGKGFEHVAMAVPPMVLGLIWITTLAPRLDVLSLGEHQASNLSIDLRTLRRGAIASTALLVGTAVAVAGAVPFVGLVVPHFTRLLVGPRHRRLILVSALNGMTLMLVADLVARTVRAPAELQVGILTSLLGAPFFLWLLWSSHRKGAAA